MIGTRYEHRESGIIWEVINSKPEIQCVRESQISGYGFISLGDVFLDDDQWPVAHWIEMPPKESTFDKLYLTLKQ